MSNFKGLAKGGWHPKGRDGGKESWRSDMKGVNQIAGWMGKGKQPGLNGETVDGARQHHSAPLTTLTDPSVFGPPPKHVNYHGPQAAAATAALPPTAVTIKNPPGSLGAPLTQEELDEREQEEREEQERHEEEERREAKRQAAPPIPYRANTTGIKTENLPKPPVRRLDAQSAVAAGRPPKPPPRLPPRQNSHPDVNAPEAPPAYTAVTPEPTQASSNSYINQNAAQRLGQAGISVPGFGIGRRATNDGAVAPSPRQMNELQQRFALMPKASSPTSETAPSQGTSWSQKQAALKTASNFHKDPSSVSFSDARNAASTANNFRQRHGDQVATGMKTANGLNQRYGVTNAASKYMGSPATAQAEPAAQVEPTPQAMAASPAGTLAKKKAPPPPPPKRMQSTGGISMASGGSMGSGSPPPIPMASKPR